MTNDIPKPEWVKLIPADSIPVFCFSIEASDYDLERIGEQLRAFFGDRKVLIMRGNVDMYAIADHDAAIFHCGFTGKACERTDCIGARCMLAEGK